MKVEQFEGRAVVETASRLRVAEISPDLHVFRYVVTSRKMERSGAIQTPQATNPEYVTHGFVDKDGIRSLKNGISPKRLCYYVMPSEVIEAYRTDGWGRVSDTLKDAEWVKDDPYALLVEQGVSLDRVVRWDHGSHMLFALDGQPLPVAIEIEYINSLIDESRYDLQKAAAILLARPDVHVYRPGLGGRINNERATTVEEAVTDIPYYNSESGRSRTIYARWMPSVEDYRRMWAKCLSLGGKYPSTNMHRAIFEEDLLGLRSGGAAHFNEFYASKKDDSDD